MRAGRWLGLVAAGWLGVVGAGAAQATPAPIPVRVMIVSMFGPEGQVWLDKRNLSQAITVPGLSPDYPQVHCGPDKVCQVTLGMGHANAAASIMALTFSQAVRSHPHLLADRRHRRHQPQARHGGLGRLGALAGGFRHPVGAGRARDPQGLVLGLSRHQYQEPRREAAARLPHRGVPARRGAAAAGLSRSPSRPSSPTAMPPRSPGRHTRRRPTSRRRC